MCIRDSYCHDLFVSFLDACEHLDNKSFVSRLGTRFNISTFEAVFVAFANEPFSARELITEKVSAEKLEELKANVDFIGATQTSTASSSNVTLRQRKAKELLRAQ